MADAAQVIELLKRQIGELVAQVAILTVERDELEKRIDEMSIAKLNEESGGQENR